MSAPGWLPLRLCARCDWYGGKGHGEGMLRKTSLPPHFKTVMLGDSEGRTMLTPKGSLVLELFQAFVWDECSPCEGHRL